MSTRRPRPAVGERVAGLVAVASRPAVAVGAVAALAALVALIISIRVFPNLSDNNDEAVYLLGADALRHGHLFPPAPAPAEAFTPWLGVEAGGKFVTKYTPVHSAFIALARLLTGTDRAVLALIAAAVVITGYLLARQVLTTRGQAVLAAALLAASPMTVVLSATYLAYLSSLALCMGGAAALLAGVRLGCARRLAAAGLLFGLAVFSRPFDAVLFALPLAGWWLWSARPPARPLRRLVARPPAGPGASPPAGPSAASGAARRPRWELKWLAAGAAAPLLAMLAFFWAATGSPLQPSFTLLDAKDTLGFGIRRMFPAQPVLDYTPGLAVVGFLRLCALTAVWAFGGLLLFGLGGAGIRWRRGDPLPWLALVAVSVPAGYLFFWGSYGSTQWGGPWRFGPFYWTPVLAPLSILGAAGLRRVWRWDRIVAGALVVAMALVSGLVLHNALDSHSFFSAERDRLYAGPRQALSLDERAIVFLPPLQGPWLLQPFALARNADPDSTVLWALDGGADANAGVLARYPDRAPYRVVATGQTVSGFRTLDYSTRLEPYPTTTDPTPGGQP